jgi:hypothetical protein
LHWQWGFGVIRFGSSYSERSTGERVSLLKFGAFASEPPAFLAPGAYVSLPCACVSSPSFLASLATVGSRSFLDLADRCCSLLLRFASGNLE